MAVNTESDDIDAIGESLEGLDLLQTPLCYDPCMFDPPKGSRPQKSGQLEFQESDSQSESDTDSEIGEASVVACGTEVFGDPEDPSADVSQPEW